MRREPHHIWERKSGMPNENSKSSLLWKDLQHGEGHIAQQESLAHPLGVCRDAIAVLARAIEAHEPAIYGHPRRVAYLAKVIAQVLGWEKERLATIETGALLHDLGKIAISDTILKKPGPFTEAEYNEVKKHPEIGAQLLIAGGPSLKAAIPYTLYHHEHYDGKGYPYGLSGEDIPIEGRILAVADAFEAMISDRPYRKRVEPKRALEIIERAAGSQFDPKVVAAFLHAWETGQFQVLLERRREEQALSLKPEHRGLAVPSGQLATP